MQDFSDLKSELNSENRFSAMKTLKLIQIIYLKYKLFTDKKKWLDYKKKFDKFSSNKNKKSTLATTLICLIIIINLIFSFYLLSKL